MVKISGSSLITTEHQARTVTYYQVTKEEIENLSNLSNIFQIFFGLATASVGGLISAMLQKYAEGYTLDSITEITFWVSLVLTIVFTAVTFLTSKARGQFKNELIKDPD